MRMRKELSIIGIALSIVFSSTFVYATDNNIVVESDRGSLQVQNFAMCESIKPIADLKSLEENSDIIIKGRILPEHENVVMLPLGYTKTKVEVTKVYKGNVKVNDIILMDEEYFVMEDERTGEKIIRALNLYKPCIDGEEYVLFLFNSKRQSAKGLNMYEILNITQGRFPVINEETDNDATESKLLKAKVRRKVVLDENKVEEMSNDELNLNEGDITQYKKLFAQVLKKYS